MNNALWPVTDFRETTEAFAVDLREAKIGSLSAMVENISTHQANRTRVDVEHTSEDCFHLFMSLEQTWGMEHEGHDERLGTGDIVVVGKGEHRTFCPQGYHGIILKCPDSWMAKWLPDTKSVLGRRIPRESRWGRVLSPIVSQITPDLSISLPMPAELLTDQLGALLAFVAGQNEFRDALGSLSAIVRCIHERSCEMDITANDVADSLNLPPDIVHRALATRSTTFADVLIDARAERALRMLASRSADGLTIAQIAAQCGFKSPAAFAVVVRNRSGKTPLALRKMHGWNERRMKC